MFVWGFVSLGCSILFVEQLNQFKIGRLPLGFWFAQQGSIIIFVALIFIFARQMDKIDRGHK
jgi:putative solute:sodium symporter small subunit